MKLKTKIQFSLVAMFAILTILGISGGYYLDRLADDSIKMMQDNYNSLSYTKEMSFALNDLVSTLSIRDQPQRLRNINLNASFDRFETYLNLQEKNSTEQGELEITNVIRNDFQVFRDTVESYMTSEIVPEEVFSRSLDMQGLLQQVYQVNEDSIKSKTDQAFRTANWVTLFMLAVGFLFFVFIAVSMVYFPDYIVGPLNRMMDGIKEISRKNYSLRLPITTKDEFGELARSFNEMAEKLDEYESMNVAKILSEKSRIETIISQMNDAIIGLNRKNVVLFASRSALRLLHMKEEDVVGRSAAAVARENDMMAYFVGEVIEEKVQDTKTYPGINLEFDGKTYYYEKDILRVPGSNQHSKEGYVIILKNITEFKEQDIAKTNFMATLSHELKTPISAIDMSLGLLQDDRIGDLNEEQKDLTNTIHHNSMRLLNMVNEILEISKIETGNIQLAIEDAPPSEIVERAIEITKSLYATKGIPVEPHIAEGLPILSVDVQKTAGVLINFLTNALRYTPEDAPVRVNVVQNNGAIEFAVTDQGPGITPEEQEKIFIRYRRRKGDKTKGTGLGLAISKEFIEKQGGKIWVESEVGKGSRFAFSLPVK